MTLRPIVRALVVPVLGLSPAFTATHGLPAPLAPPTIHVVNVNQATGAELRRIPRVGPNLAARIVSHRMQHGPFRRPEDLMQVKGIGERFFATLRHYVAVAGPTTLV